MDINPYQPPQAEVLVSSAIIEAESIRRAHLNHEASVKSVGTLYILGGMLCMAMAATSFLHSDPQRPLFVILGVAVFFLAIAAVQFWTGAGLRSLKPTARIPAAILSGIGLIRLPLGTIINAYIMYLLLCKKGRAVLSSGYGQVVAQTPHITYKTSILMILLLVMIVVGVIVAIAFIAGRD